MARRMKFAEFKRRLQSRRLSSEDIEDYLEIDPTAPQIRVRFRPGTLEDLPPEDYDVDHALYLYQRARDRAREKTTVRTAKPRVVAEGDSWFHLPLIVRPTAIATHIHDNGGFLVRNIARWGDTLQGMLVRKEYLNVIKSFDPAWFIFSGGGNDVQEALAKRELLFDYDPARPLENSVTPKGEALLSQIGTGYQTLLREVMERFPNLPVLCYGYDYPRPDVADGRYIGRYLREQGYPTQTMRPLLEIILDRLNEIIKRSVLSFPTGKFISCLRVTDPYTWFDDMHPDNDGFKVLAARFEARMKEWARSTRSARKKSRRR
ncbi:MAG: SGNH/GDSL hydrolase family protein [Candidatus Binatia bacterium]